MGCVFHPVRWASLGHMYMGGSIMKCIMCSADLELMHMRRIGASKHRHGARYKCPECNHVEVF